MLFGTPEHDDSVYEQRLRDASRGVLHPESGAVIRGGVYDSLVVEEGVSRVELKHVTVLNSIEIRGLGITGSIQYPVGLGAPATGPNPVGLYPKLWRPLALGAGVTPQE